jgi:adenine deaminase
MREILERRVDQAMGRMAADLVVRNTRILDVATGVFHSGDIAICGDVIVGTGDSYRGVREIDAGGRIAVPGFVDSHVHCESTLVVPGEFDRCVLTRGTTTAICDPHEICNVLGLAGLRYFLDSALGTAMDSAGAAFLLRSGNGTRNFRRPARRSRPSRLPRSSEGDRARRVHERAGRAE